MAFDGWNRRGIDSVNGSFVTSDDLDSCCQLSRMVYSPTYFWCSCSGSNAFVATKSSWECEWDQQHYAPVTLCGTQPYERYLNANTLVYLHLPCGGSTASFNWSFFTLAPTTSPTKAPTRTPTRTPTTRAPTHSPTVTPTTNAPTSVPTLAPECVVCNTTVPSVCDGLEVEKRIDLGGCSAVNELVQVIAWTSSPAASVVLRNAVCSVLDHWKDCNTTINHNLFTNVCADLRNNIHNSTLDHFNSKWCLDDDNNNNNVTLPYSRDWNTTLDINYTEVSHQAPCVETAKYSSDASSGSSGSSGSYLELGPLADVVAHPEKYPNFPPIKMVQTGQSTAVLYNTGCLESRAVAPAWAGLLGAFLFVALLMGVLLFKRRHLQPVRARDPLLLWGGLACVCVNFVWVAIDQLTGNTASCGLISFGNLVAFPMLLFVYLLRALRLLFLYKWAEANMKNKSLPSSQDSKRAMWFHSHRYLLQPRSILICLAGCFLVCFIVFVATNAEDGTFNDTFLSSGRCLWWDIDQQVIAAASEAGVPLLPTDFHPNGFVPHSVVYSSCVFCSSFATQVLMCVLTVLLLCAIVVALVLLRKIHDQFKLLFELVWVLAVLSAVAVLRSVLFFPSAASSLMASVGSDLAAIFLVVALFVLLLLSGLYPAALTFTRRFRDPDDATYYKSKNKDTAGGGTGTIGSKGDKTSTSDVSMMDVLNDPVGLELLREFSLQSFVVENITYWCAVKEFELLDVSDPSRGAEALKIFELFIKEGSSMELNIEATLRHKYERVFGDEQALSDESPPPATTSESGPATDLLPADVFAELTRVVLALISSDIWRRFVRSPFWDKLQAELRSRDEHHSIASEAGTQMSRLDSRFGD